MKTSVLAGFPTEEVCLIKKNGSQIEHLKAIFGNKITMDDSPDYKIEEEDIILRVQTNEKYLVLDRGFMNGGFSIPSHYQIKSTKDLEYFQKEKYNSSAAIIYNVKNENGSVIIGNVNNSPISINNSFTELERKIESDGGDEKEKLLDLLEQVKELCENMEETKTLPKSKSLMKKLSEHMTTHAWFYTEVAKIIGATVMKVIENI